MPLTAERLHEIWKKRGIQGDIPKDAMTHEERQEVNALWSTMDGTSCWSDAFHKLWRELDPEGHKAMFRSTFYESEQSMHPAECNVCGSDQVVARINGRDYCERHREVGYGRAIFSANAGD